MLLYFCIFFPFFSTLPVFFCMCTHYYSCGERDWGGGGGGDFYQASFPFMLSKVHLSINVYRVYLSLDLCRNIVIIGRYMKGFVAAYVIQ
jgi:hypothetical protein